MMTEKRFKKGDFDEDCPRFVPFERDLTVIKNYTIFDIVDTEKLDYVGFIGPYNNIKDCQRDCNIMNVIDYLFKEFKG